MLRGIAAVRAVRWSTSINLYMKKLLFLFCFLIVSESLHAQLLSWRDIIQEESAKPTSRFSYGPDSLQFGELWMPDDESPHTTVIMIHGGCWLNIYPGTELMDLIAEDLSQNGFAVWNIEYRRLGHDGGGYPGTFLDAANGADYIREITEDYDLSLDRVIATGHSAGGHLAGWLASRKKISEESPLYSEDPIEIDGVISLAGINNLEMYANYGSAPCGDQTVEKLVDIEERGEDAYLDTSPVELLPLGIPFIEVNAAFDSPVPPFFGYQFIQAAKRAGDPAQHILLTNAGHFEVIQSGTDEWQKVRSLFESILD